MELIVVGIIAEILLGILLYKLDYRRYTFAYLILAVPILLFSLNMVNEAVTVDEMQYIKAYSDLRNIPYASLAWVKASYQYRTSQVVIGTIFIIIRQFYSTLQEETALVLYKLIHWFMYYSLSIIISYFWGKYILFEGGKITRNLRISNFLIYCILVGTPISCLILKAANYDAGNIYFAITGFSAVIAAEKKQSARLAFIGTMLVTFGCMEKSVCLVYWYICVAFYAFLKAIQGKNIRDQFARCIWAVVKLFLISSIICYLSLFYLRAIEGKGFLDLSLGTGLFPLMFMLKAVKSKCMRIDFSPTLSTYDQITIPYLCAGILLVCLLSMVLLVFYKKIYINHSGMCRKVVGYIFIGLIICGIIGAYSVIEFRYPVLEIPSNTYIPKQSYDGSVYFYNAKTYLEHLILQNIFTYSQILSYIPSSLMLSFLIAGAFLIVRYNKEKDYIFLSLLLATLILPILFTIAGQASTQRYFGVSILFWEIAAIYILANIKFPFHRYFVRCGVLIGSMLFCFEMILFIPNFHVFRPIWIIHPKEYRENAISGVNRAGQAITWGENVAIGCNMIKEYLESENMKNRNLKIYSNYSSYWLKNHYGFDIISMYDIKNPNDIQLDKNSYFIIARVNIVNRAIPTYMLKEKPFLIKKYNGECSIWIYRGDMLCNYRDELILE